MKKLFIILLSFSLQVIASDFCLDSEKEIKQIYNFVKENIENDRIITACNELDRTLYFIKEYEKKCQYKSEIQKEEYQNIKNLYKKSCK